jgi:hypothetical protein
MTSDKGENETTKQEWQRPNLRKLPIAATASSANKMHTQADGSPGSKSADAGSVS